MEQRLRLGRGPQFGGLIEALATRHISIWFPLRLIQQAELDTWAVSKSPGGLNTVCSSIPDRENCKTR